MSQYKVYNLVSPRREIYQRGSSVFEGSRISQMFKFIANTPGTIKIPLGNIAEILKLPSSLDIEVNASGV
jgi:hypothetical protein